MAFKFEDDFAKPLLKAKDKKHKFDSEAAREYEKKHGVKTNVCSVKLSEAATLEWKAGDKDQVLGDDRGPWIMTFTGRHFHFADPSPDEVDIMDIAVATSREGRFAGHCWSFYSVAQHSVYVSERIESLMRGIGKTENVPRLSLLGLLHDASEAYIKDMPSPVKAYLPDYKKMETKIMSAIMETFNLGKEWNDPEVQALLHKVDKGVMTTEVRDMIKHKKVWSMPEKAYDDLVIVPVSPDTACVQFLYRFHTLMRQVSG